MKPCVWRIYPFVERVYSTLEGSEVWMLTVLTRVRFYLVDKDPSGDNRYSIRFLCLYWPLPNSNQMKWVFRQDP